MPATVLDTNAFVEPGANRFFKTYEADFVADGSGVFPQVSFSDKGGFFRHARVKFGTVPPNSLEIKVLDKDGIDLLGGSGSGVNAFTASGKVDVSPQAHKNGITIDLSGNTTVSAEVKVVLYDI